MNIQETRWQDFVLNHAATQPEALALRDDIGTRWSYADLAQAIEELSTHLAQAGATPGQRVMILAENCATAVAAIFAAAALGAIAVPINARQTAAEVDKIIQHADPAVILATSAVSTNARTHAERLGAQALQGGFGELHLLARAGAEAEPDRDVAAMLYTTGTTGTPKGVMLTHANLIYAGHEARRYRGLTPDHLVYGVAPMTHVIGLASMMTATICSGATIWLAARFTVEGLYEALGQGITHLPAVPQMHALLMSHVQGLGHATLGSERLEYVSSGGAPLDPAWKRKAEAFYGLALQNGYGMTECTAASNITLHEIGNPDISVGAPLRGVEIAIDETVPGGGEGKGEVLIKGPNVMRGYFRNPEETARVLDAQGWLHSGDLGRVDDLGHLHILGRSKELIIHGGFNVYPPEVEAALNDHPKVVQAAVVGMMVDGDEKPVAFVQGVATDLPEVEDLRAFAAERLTGYKRPVRIVVATELPSAPTGKVLKHKLLDHFEQELGHA